MDYGNNALEAVSSLPSFQQGIGINSLSTIDNKAVTILINGVPSDAMTLRSYHGKDVLKVEFYPHAPIKYMNLTKGALVNVITRKRVDRLYSAYINGWEGLLQTNGELQGALTYADSLNQVKINYYTQHGNNFHRDETTYSYPDGIVNEYSGRGRTKYHGNNLTASYQYFSNKYLFNATFSQGWHPSKSHMDRRYSVIDDGALYEGMGGSDSKDRYNVSSLSLFFNHQLSNTQGYSLQVTGGYADSRADSRLWRDSRNPALAYNLLNDVRNRVYSFTANFGYNIRKLYFGAFYSYSRIDQTSAGIEYRPVSEQTYLYAGYPFSAGDNMTITPNVGVIFNHNSSMGVKNDRTVPYFTLNYNIWAKGDKLKGFSGRAYFLVSTDYISASKLTGSQTYADDRFIIVGNPYLKNIWFASGNFTLAYYRPDGKLSAQLNYNPSYSNRNNAPVIFAGEEGYFYQTSMDLGHKWSHSFSLSGKWRVRDWFNIGPYFEYYMNDYTTPTQHVELNYFRAGGSVEFAWHGFTLSMAANSPVKYVTGDLYTFSTAQYASSLNWKHGNYSVGLQWNYSPQKEYKRGEADGFMFTDVSRGREHSLMLRVSLYFSKGKARRHPNAGGAAGVDNGLRSDQSVKR